MLAEAQRRPTAPRGVRKVHMKQCSFEGCDKQVSVKGLCNGHYKQLNRGVELQPIMPSQSPSNKLYDEYSECVAWQCTNKPMAKWLCPNHYRKYRKGVGIEVMKESPSETTTGWDKKCKSCGKVKPWDAFPTGVDEHNRAEKTCRTCWRDSTLGTGEEEKAGIPKDILKCIDTAIDRIHAEEKRAKELQVNLNPMLDIDSYLLYTSNRRRAGRNAKP